MFQTRLKISHATSTKTTKTFLEIGISLIDDIIKHYAFVAVKRIAYTYKYWNDDRGIRPMGLRVLLVQYSVQNDTSYFLSQCTAIGENCSPIIYITSKFFEGGIALYLMSA